MALQYSVNLRNAQLDALETHAGTSAILRLYSGSVPANVAASITGTMLCQITLPSDYFTAASSGVMSKTGTWSGAGDAGAGSGTACTHFRLWMSNGTTGVLQGTVTITAGGGDMTVDNTSIASAQVVTINTFAITATNS